MGMDEFDRRPATLLDVLSAAVERRRGATAVRDGSRRLTYEALDRASDQLADALAGRRVGNEDRVAILMERGIDLVVAMVGIVKAGAAYVGVDVEYPEGRRRFMLEDSGARVVVTHRGWSERLPEPARALEWHPAA